MNMSVLCVLSDMTRGCSCGGGGGGGGGGGSGGVQLAHRGGLDCSLAALFITLSLLLFFFLSFSSSSSSLCARCVIIINKSQGNELSRARIGARPRPETAWGAERRAKKPKAAQSGARWRGSGEHDPRRNFCK